MPHSGGTELVYFVTLLILFFVFARSPALGLIAAGVGAFLWLNVTFNISVGAWLLIAIAIFIAIGLANYAFQARAISDQKQLDSVRDAYTPTSSARHKEYERLVTAGRRARRKTDSEQRGAVSGITEKSSYLPSERKQPDTRKIKREGDCSRNISTEQNLSHDFCSYDRDAPEGIAHRKYCRNHTNVAGIQFHRAEALRYIDGAASADINGGPHGLILRREPDNPHDSNAIRVLGWWGTEQVVLGYVPREIALAYARIVDRGGRLMAVPKRAYRGHDDYVDVRLVIYGIEA